MVNRNTILNCLLALLLLSATPAMAEVYKYQDKNGKWHFTDKPPKDKATTAVTSTSTTGAAKANLSEDLSETFKPASKIDLATLAVVTVSTRAGSGSGFFITDDGYLVTNRHVVRPASSTQWQDHKEELAERQQRLDEFKHDLDEDARRLREMKLTIDEDRAYIESKHASETHKAQYKRYVERYQRDKERHESNERKYRKLSKQFKKAKSDFGWSSSVSNFSKKFTITLKGGKELRARLVRVSKDYDLALLKLDSYTTPYLALSAKNYPRQGTKVFAIGSPLGISDALTTGIITKSGKEHLITDTRILPGNSGGPLVDGEGTVLGVNTAVVSQDENTDSLGIAIYAERIRREFARELSGKI